MRELNVLIWHWGRRGGGPRYTLELVRALRDCPGLNLYLSLSRQSQLFEQFAALDLPGFHINTYSGLWSAAMSSVRIPFVRRDFWRYVEDNGIDVVVCTMSHVWNVVTLRRRRRARFMLVLHDAVPHPGDDVMLRQWLLRREIVAADGIVTLTRHVRQVLHGAYHYPPERTWVIPHGVFPYSETQVRTGLSDGRRFQLLFFGRILPYKGLDLLLHAYRDLRQEFPSLHLSIVGPGDMAPYADLLHGLAGVTVDNRWIPEEEIGPIFDQADLVILPYREASQSGVAATAYSAGLPVVATPVGGLIEQVRHEKTGLVSEHASAVALSAAVRRLLTEPKLYEQCAHAALHEGKEVLAWPVIAREFNQAITRVTAMNPRSEVG